MSSQTTTSGAQLPSKPVTRSSIRQSLNLSSVGKALADVMHKDTRDAGDKEKVSKRTKDLNARRSSTINTSLLPSRASIDKPSVLKEDELSPDAKARTIGRHTRRTSTLKKPPITDSDDTSSSPQTPKMTHSRTASLRPRTSNAASALPKYRPRSMLGESAAANLKKPPSPTRVVTRSQASSARDHKGEDALDNHAAGLQPPPAGGKLGRSVSPVPHPAALKVNLTQAINITPQTPEKKVKALTQKRSPPPSPSPRHGSSTRPSKTAKTSLHASASQPTIPRPPSSASSSTSSQTPRTPRSGLFGSSTKNVSGTRSQRSTPSPSPLSRTPKSPLQHASTRKTPVTDVSDFGRSSVTPTPGAFAEGSSMDSIEDVEFMLSSVASPTAPTPALPRFRLTGDQERPAPHTPSRPFLPSRAHLSYLSPQAPSSTNSSPFLRPIRRLPGNERGSILSWEQLAKQSMTLQDEDVEHMLSEIPAPFRSGAVSPSLSTSTLDIPESPTLSALPSPTGYGSISQVLLPDVTPSPAVHGNTARFDSMAADATMEDGANVTLLRLQLASAETKARDRLAEIESLESQLQMAKAARQRDTEELGKQISQLEEQIHGNLHADSERLQYITSIEEQLRQAHVAREQAVQEALHQMQQHAQATYAAAVKVQQQKWELSYHARETANAWNAVRGVAEGELELVQANREMLAVLLAGLDQSHRQLLSASA